MNVEHRLTEAVKRVKEYERLQHQMEINQNMLQTEKKRREILQEKLAAENRDVEKLDGISLVNLWHTLRGTKDIAMRKEQEEYLAAKLKFDEANNIITFLEADLTKMSNKLKDIGDPGAEYQKAIRDKEAALLQSGGDKAWALLELAEQLGKAEAEKQELKEAVAAGQLAQKSLITVEKKLGSAQGWGVVDIIGGGLITTAIKHSFMGEARRGIREAEKHLRSFQRELADVKTDEITFNIGQFSTLADFILDGLLFDLIVQSQINKAVSQTSKLRQNIEATINDLQNLLELNTQAASAIEVRRKSLIENA